MKLKSKLILTALCMATAYSLVAQSQNKDEKAKKPKPKPIPTYLGKSDKSGGPIPEALFDKLVLEGLTAKDSAGRDFKVTAFVINYGERNLYEDSVGNMMVLTDYLAESCSGDTLSTFLKANITERSKPGDTVYFEQVLVKAPEGFAAFGKSMKFVITK